MLNTTSDEDVLDVYRKYSFVQVFQKKLQTARRIVIVGNGGIATELA